MGNPLVWSCSLNILFIFALYTINSVMMTVMYTYTSTLTLHHSFIQHTLFLVYIHIHSLFPILSIHISSILTTPPPYSPHILNSSYTQLLVYACIHLLGPHKCFPIQRLSHLLLKHSPFLLCLYIFFS